VGGSGTLVKTDDGGLSWTSVPLPTPESLYGVDFIDQNIGMIVGSDGICLITADGGTSWTQVTNVFEGGLRAVDMLDEDAAWVCGQRIVASTEDGGNLWNQELRNIPVSAWHNVIAEKTGMTYPDQYYIVCAHYDAVSEVSSTQAPGADDNASGTAAVLEAARVLADHDFDYSLRFILFAGEEQGLLGSAAYAADAAQNGDQILGVINLDMIAYDGDDNRHFEIHTETMPEAQALGDLLETNVYGWDLYLVPWKYTNNAAWYSDHASFWRAGYPAVLVIEDWSDHTPHYHTTGDVYSTLNRDYLLELSRLTVGTMAVLGEIDETSVSESLPADFNFRNPYPNPFNMETVIAYSLPGSGKVEIGMFDLLGRRCMTLVNGFQDRGIHRIVWDGTDGRGRDMPTGVYFVRLVYDRQEWVKKIVLLR
jgi:hypothetical protein